MVKDTTIITCVGIICSTVGFCYCISQGYDSTVIATFFATLGTIVGYGLGRSRK